MVGNLTPPAFAHLCGAGPPFTTLVDPCCPETGVTDIPWVARATWSPEMKLDLVAGLFDRGPRFEVNWEVKIGTEEAGIWLGAYRTPGGLVLSLHRVFLIPL